MKIIIRISFYTSNFDLFNYSTLLFYHNRIHNSIKFYLIALCLIIGNHHLPCPFPLLGADIWFSYYLKTIGGIQTPPNYFSSHSFINAHNM